MNWVDAAILAVVACSGLWGFLRGMVREVLGLAAWVAAGIAAAWFYPDALALARKAIANPDVANPVAFGAVFLVVLIVFSLIARILAGAVRRSVLGGLDRTLGLLYGLARGAVLAIIAYVVAGTVEPVGHWPDAALEARTMPSIYLGAAWAARQVPPAYRPIVAAPPAGRTESSAELLHANPVGRAVGAQPARPQ